MKTSVVFLDQLRNLAGGSGRLVEEISFAGRAGTTTPWPTWASAPVVAAFQNQGVTAPWQHQVDAASSIYAGQHTVVSTGTGSGKSLAAWLPVLEKLENPAPTGTSLKDHAKPPTALYLAPTKALAADQAHKLTGLCSELPGVRLGVADGDTNKELKDWARAHANLVISNPDYLHHVMLPGNQRWSRFLGGLKYIVIDEMHYWRGITGSHIALVLRRLLRVARLYGASPTVVFLSATVADPAHTAAALIGEPVNAIHAVTADTSPASARELVLWQPGFIAVEDETEPKRGSATAEAAVLTAHLVAAGARVLTFVRSRAAAESVAAHAQDILSGLGVSPEFVAAYRGGYLPEERRELERSLRSGSLRALITTNALELGIDISGLDASITVGWPGTRASLWQQFGRAGRAGNTGIGVFIASDNPLDNYIINHPSVIFEPVEAATINPANPFVLTPHLCAASAEAPLTATDAVLFGLPDTQYFQQLEAAGYLRLRPAGWYWNVELNTAPHTLTELRGEVGEVQVVEATTGRVIGTIPAGQADAQVHPGAVYVHQGETYQIIEYVPVGTAGSTGAGGSDSGSLAGSSVTGGSDSVASGSGSADGLRGGGGTHVALAQKITTQFRTRAGSETNVQIQGPASKSWTAPDGAVTWRLGNTQVGERVTDFDTLRLPGLEYITNTKLVMPTRNLDTQSVWFELSPDICGLLQIAAADLPGTLHAAEHAMIAILPLLATCDRWDLGGLSTIMHHQTLLPTVFVHDAMSGGAGFAAYGYAHAAQWVQRTLELVRQCPCQDGCPACIQSPKCGNRNNPLCKAGAVRLLEFLSQRAPGV